MSLDYRFSARITDSIEIGPVDGGLRIDNHFDGEMTEGVLAGARVRGVDQVRIRPDGVAVLDIRETIETAEGPIAADVRGYARPLGGGDDRHRITGFALFSTALSEYADYNSAVVAVEGAVDMRTGVIDVRGRVLNAIAPATAA